jgi:hypothetical protein
VRSLAIAFSFARFNAKRFTILSRLRLRSTALVLAMSFLVSS